MFRYFLHNTCICAYMGVCLNVCACVFKHQELIQKIVLNSTDNVCVNFFFLMYFPIFEQVAAYIDDPDMQLPIQKL